MKDFFISYTSNDSKKAQWIAYILEENNYTVIIQDWDFQSGENFVLKMEKALKNCEQTIAVLSYDYLASAYTQAEYASAFRKSPTGEKRSLITVRISDCQPEGLLGTIIYIDLVGLNEQEASKKLLQEIEGKRRKPLERPKWDENTENKSNQKDILINKIKQLKSLLRTSKVTFDAQRKVRNKLFKKVRRRLNVPRVQYEEFFRQHFGELNEEEKLLHQTMRGYTKDILFQYNSKILHLINENESLLELKSISQLKNHLEIWLSKYNNIFKKDDSMCLIYAGVVEKVPFPSDNELNDDLEKLLRSL